MNPWGCDNWPGDCDLSLTWQAIADELCRVRTSTGNDRLWITRNAHDNLLLHMQQKVVIGNLCIVRGNS